MLNICGNKNELPICRGECFHCQRKKKAPRFSYFSFDLSEKSYNQFVNFGTTVEIDTTLIEQMIVVVEVSIKNKPKPFCMYFNMRGIC